MFEPSRRLIGTLWGVIAGLGLLVTLSFATLSGSADRYQEELRLNRGNNESLKRQIQQREALKNGKPQETAALPDANGRPIPVKP